jgi:hypothetical protein
MGGGLRGGIVGGGFRSATVAGGFRGVSMRGGFVGSRIDSVIAARLRGGAIRGRGWPLWRLVLDLATNPLGLAAALGL